MYSKQGKGEFDMRSSAETYREVAERCSAYEKKCSCKGHTNEVTGKSCLSCDHFTDTEHCELDLYDPIVRNLK
jgi:hypothetical protein